MGLDLSISAFTGAGGGLSYVLVALLVAVSHGRARFRLLLAGLVGSQGLSFGLMSLTTPERTGPEPAAAAVGVALVLLFGILMAGFASALAILLARDTSRRATWVVGGALMVLATMAAVFLAQGGITPGKGDPAAMPPEVRLIFTVVLVGYAASAVAVLAMGLHWKARAWPATGAVALAVALVPLPELVSGAARSTPEALLAAFAIVCVLGWAPPWREHRSAPATFLGLLGWTLAVQLMRVFLFPDLRGNSYGSIEVVGALGLALVLVKRRAWDMQPPRLALRRGPLAAVALAALFIVAQVAQEFFASEYGLLLGGAVAGSLLFAAHPVQRAMERLADRESRTGGPGSAAGGRDEAYQDAVRLALRASLTRDEEYALARLARELGIDAHRALELRHEVEDGREVTA